MRADSRPNSGRRWQLFRSAAEKKRGTVLEGCLAYELCLIDLDLKHGRLG